MVSSLSGTYLSNEYFFINMCFHRFTGAERFYNNIEDMIGYRPISAIKYCLKYITPVVCMVSCCFIKRSVKLFNFRVNEKCK